MRDENIEVFESDSFLTVVEDRRPKVNEPYINTHFVGKAINVHTHIRHIKNHQKDYRWRFCKVVVASDNPIYDFPSVSEYLSKFNPPLTVPHK